jgi:hypothetical protein
VTSKVPIIQSKSAQIAFLKHFLNLKFIPKAYQISVLAFLISQFFPLSIHDLLSGQFSG